MPALILRRFFVYLAAPLLVNFLLFTVYLLAGPALVQLPAHLPKAERATELLILRLIAFSTPITYSLLRTRMFRKSISGHEIALVVFSTWLLAECADLISLIQSQSIPLDVLVYRGCKIALFAVLGLACTSAVINLLRVKLLHESTFFFRRSVILLLISIGYLAASAVVLVINYHHARQPMLFLTSVGSVTLIVVALNVHAFVLFRNFYRGVGTTGRQPLHTEREAIPAVFQSAIQARLNEMLSYAEMLESKNSDVDMVRSRIARAARELGRHFEALESRDRQKLQGGGRFREQPESVHRRILVIEGAEISRIILSEYLKSACDCQIDTATNGRDGIHAALSLAYDLIIVDIGLTDISGIDVSTAIREHGVSAPIIAISSGREDLRGDAIAAGVNVYLEKPVTREQVLLHLQEQL